MTIEELGAEATYAVFAPAQGLDKYLTGTFIDVLLESEDEEEFLMGSMDLVEEWSHDPRQFISRIYPQDRQPAPHTLTLTMKLIEHNVEDLLPDEDEGEFIPLATEDISQEAFDAVIVPAQALSELLAVAFASAIPDCADEEEWLDTCSALIHAWRHEPVTFQEIAYANAPMPPKEDLGRTMLAIEANLFALGVPEFLAQFKTAP